MPKKRSGVEKAIGKLILAIQKEWRKEIGEPIADTSMAVMDKAHDLLQARSSVAMTKLLRSRTVTQYLGPLWVEDHPSIKRAISNLEQLLKST